MITVVIKINERQLFTFSYFVEYILLLLLLNNDVELQLFNTIPVGFSSLLNVKDACMFCIV